MPAALASTLTQHAIVVGLQNTIVKEDPLYFLMGEPIESVFSDGSQRTWEEKAASFVSTVYTFESFDNLDFPNAEASTVT